jgi:hypothetical protein
VDQRSWESGLEADRRDRLADEREQALDERGRALDARERVIEAQESRQHDRKEATQSILAEAAERDDAAEERDAAASRRDAAANMDAWLEGDANFDIVEARRAALGDRLQAEVDRGSAAGDRSLLAEDEDPRDAST